MVRGRGQILTQKMVRWGRHSEAVCVQRSLSGYEFGWHASARERQNALIAHGGDQILGFMLHTVELVRRHIQCARVGLAPCSRHLADFGAQSRERCRPCKGGQVGHSRHLQAT